LSTPEITPESDIKELGLSRFCQWALRKAGINKVGDLLALSRKALLKRPRRVPDIGPSRLLDTEEALTPHGLSLSP
jgi:hypothetical protein